MNHKMKTTIAALFLILSWSNSFCQRQIDPPLSKVIDKVAEIDTYVNEVNKNPKLSRVQVFDTPEFIENSVYSKIEFGISNFQTSFKVLKIVKVTQNVNTSYFKDGHIVYMNEISSVHDNYSNIKNVYFQNDSIIYATNNVIEEHILQIQCSYNGAEQGGSYTLIINKDSIKYSGDKKIETKNSASNWTALINSFNLTTFDKIKTGYFLAYIDGHDLSYVITTDKRVHAFVNVYSDPGLKKMAEFFRQIDFLIPSQKR
jgi:hypothetical protein